MWKRSAPQEESPAQLIDAKNEELGDWRGTTLSPLRDVREGDEIDEKAVVSLIRAAVSLNESAPR